MSQVSGLGSSMHIAFGSMNVHTVGLQIASHNIANINTKGFSPQIKTYATGSDGVGVALESVRKIENPSNSISGTELAREIPNLISTQRAFEANAATIRTTDEMLGSLLNTVA